MGTPIAKTKAAPLASTTSDVHQNQPVTVWECRWGESRKKRMKMILAAVWLYRVPATASSLAEMASRLISRRRVGTSASPPRGETPR